MQFVIEVCLHHHGPLFKQLVHVVALVQGLHQQGVGTFLPHLSHAARRRSQLVPHRTDLHLLVQRSFSHQVLLIYLTDRLGSQQGPDFGPASALLPVHVEVFSLDFVVLVGLLFALEGRPFLVDFPLGKDTGLDQNFLLGPGIQVHLHSIITLPVLLTVVLLKVLICVVEFVLDFWVQLGRHFDLFGPEHPLWHFGEGLLAFAGHEVVVEERSWFIGFIFLHLGLLLLEGHLPVINDNTIFFFQVLSSQLVFFLLGFLLLLEFGQCCLIDGLSPLMED